MALDLKILALCDQSLLASAAPGVFDHPIDSALAAEFLGDPRHHLAVAIDQGQVVGFASGVHYVHPDKPPELWINEVAVAPTHRRQGVGQAVIRTLLARGAQLGCAQAWVLTDDGNSAAMSLYASVGGTMAPVPSTMFTFPIVTAAARA